jgi:tetratricopeptide (TPR) repeat protein
LETRDEFLEIIRNSVPDYLLSMRYFLTHNDPWQVIWYWQHLSSYIWLLGLYSEHIECEGYAFSAAEQIKAVDQHEGQRLQGQIAADLAFVHLEIAELDKAEEFEKQSETIFRSLGDHLELARVLRFKATIAYRRQDYEKTLGLCQEGLQLLDEAEYAEKDQKRGIGKDNRITDLERSWNILSVKEKIQSMRAPFYNLLGDTYRMLDDYQESTTAILIALNLSRQLPKDAKVYYSLDPMINLAKVCLANKRLAHARRLLKRAIEWTNDGTRPDSRAGALLLMAMLEGQESHIDLAFRFSKDAMELYEAIGNYIGRDKVTLFIQSLASRSNDSLANHGELLAML